MAQARFIVFEGPDGSGKSTALGSVSKHLKEQGIRHLCTREPGGSPAAEHLRTALLAPVMATTPAEAQLLLIYAARVAHLEATVRPALLRGEWVLCDRYIDSSYVYQAQLGGVDPDALDQLNRLMSIQMPDLRLFFRVGAKTALGRLQGRADQNRMDASDLESWQRVADAYVTQSTRWPDTLAWIDAEQDPTKVAAQCHKHLQAYV